jgi:hypothetical protein
MTPKKGAVDLADLDPALRAQLGKKIGKKLRLRRAPPFPKDEVRRYAFRALAVLADLTQNERRRVLAQAAKLNEL